MDKEVKQMMTILENNKKRVLKEDEKMQDKLDILEIKAFCYGIIFACILILLALI